MNMHPNCRFERAVEDVAIIVPNGISTFTAVIVANLRRFGPDDKSVRGTFSVRPEDVITFHPSEGRLMRNGRTTIAVDVAGESVEPSITSACFYRLNP